MDRQTQHEQALNELGDHLTLKMRELFHRDGGIHIALLGYDDNLQQTLSITQGNYGDPVEKISGQDSFVLYVIPAPLRDYAAGIAQLARDHNVSTFAMMSENWVYPEGEEGVQAALAFMRGDGPSPSQHPNRQELVSVFVTCPKENYTRFIGWDIRRKNRSAPRLRPKFDSNLEPAEGAAAIVASSSWLEDCLKK